MKNTKLHKALKKQKQHTQQVEQELYGSLGIPLGGRKLTDVQDRPSFVYVRLRDNQNEVIQAFNNKVTASYDLPVIIRREGTRYVVDGVNTQRYQSNWNNSAAYLPRHGINHSFYPGGGGDVTWVYSRQIMPYLVYPDSTTTGTFLKISPHTLLDANNQWKMVGGTGTVSLLQYRPTGGNDAVMGLLYVDAITGNPNILINSGTPFSNLLTGTGDIYPYIPVPDRAIQIPLAAVRISTGTSNINWDNLYDVRQWVHTQPSGTSSGGSGSGTYVNIWDEGVLKGTVNTLNVVSAVADISVSGTVARLFITGSTGGGTVNPPVTGSFVVQNSGQTLGSATILNFTNGLYASISGTVASIFPSGTSTYIRTAVPNSLSSVTGTYWQVPDQIFVTGSLAVFNQGHALIPGIDYVEQYANSGTFQYISLPPTGTYNLSIYGVPAAGISSTSTNSGGGNTLISEILPSGTNVVSFTGIPSTYKHLLIEYVARSTKPAVTSEELGIFINNDTTLSNYRNARMYAYAAGTVGGDGFDLSDIDTIPAANSPANSASIGTINIPFYSSTAFNKMVRSKSTSRRDASSVQQIVFDAGVEWESSSAITRFDIKLPSGNFVYGSSFRLYGVL